jgi:hypothetical protein
MSETPYKRPFLHVGMPLEVAFDTSFNKPMLGIVNMVKTNSASILLHTDRGPMIYPDCRPFDDPWLKDHPAWVADRGHAIFKLTAAEQERIEIRDTVRKMIPLIEQQAQKIAELESRMSAAAHETDPSGNLNGNLVPVNRRAGRPRKQETVEIT